MRVLVTGSEGTLGRPLTKELRARGHEVGGCDRVHSADEFFVRADVASYKQLERAFKEFEPHAVYHLAAEFGRHNGEEFYEDLWKTGAIGTRNVLELCKSHSSYLLFASSSEVYGESPQQREDWEEYLRPVNEYALSKRVNEQQICNFQKRHGLQAVLLRFFNAYGPGEHYTPYRSVVAQFCHNALYDKPLRVYENYYRTFQYIEDFIPTVANACERVLQHFVYNIGGKDYRSVQELAELVLETVGSEAEIELVPEDLHNVRSKRPAIERARRGLDHNPTVMLEEGVPATIDWMKQMEERRNYVTNS